MKLSEITDKESFLNILKNPKVEKVRQGLEELVDTFRKSHWVFTYELEEKLNRFKIRIRPEEPVMITQSAIEDLWTQHGNIILTKFPIKHLNRRIMSRMTSAVGFYLIIDDQP